MGKAVILIAAWLVSPTDEMYWLGIRDAEFVNRYRTLEECKQRLDEIRRSPDPYSPFLKFICIDLAATN